MADIDDVMDKLDDVMDKLDELETNVNTDRDYYVICPYCRMSVGGASGCSYCNGTGFVLHGKMQKVEE